MKTAWRQVIFENLSYKIVALLISLILWMTILGRRDFEVTRNVELDIVPPVGMVVASQTAERVKVKVAGPRTALRRFLEGGGPILSLDLSHNEVGTYSVTIPTQKLDLPFGVKVISIKPADIEVRLQKQ